MEYEFHLAPYILIGTYVGSPGDRFLIDDKFKDDTLGLVLLHHELSGSLLLCTVEAVLNLDGSTIFILGSSNPEDRLESTFHTYYAVRLVSPTVVELVEEKLSESIYELVQEAVDLDREENLGRVQSVFGTLRIFDHANESVPYFKK